MRPAFGDIDKELLMKVLAWTLSGIAAVGLGVAAQQPPAQQPPASSTPAPPTSLVTEVKGFYTAIQGNISKAVAQFPADKQTWQPTPDVRSWARLIAHIVDDNNSACAVLAGEAAAPPRLDAPNSPESAANKMSKADLEKALADSAARCDKAFAAVNDTNMMQPNGRRSKLGTLIYNTSHINEHYGNIVTYMRLNGMVPPSSQPKTGQ
jgi:uncharacterized damage-inducible protein DinB